MICLTTIKKFKIEDVDATTEDDNTDNDTSNEESSFCRSPRRQHVLESDNLEKMILSTGIRVGTPVKTKYMTPFIVRANPEGLYILDISKTLAKIDVAAKFIGRANISRVAVTSAREYGKTPVEKFCELTEQQVFLDGLCQERSQTRHCQNIWSLRS